jgi:hypothetical protein
MNHGSSSPATDPASIAGTPSLEDLLFAFPLVLVAFSGRIQPLLVKSDKLSAQATMWLLLGPGIALALAGAAGLLRPQARERPMTPPADALQP